MLRNIISLSKLKNHLSLFNAFTGSKRLFASTKIINEGTLPNPEEIEVKNASKDDSSTEKKTDKVSPDKEHEKFTSVAALTEFFDDQSNWNLKEIKVGRGWRLEELRIKSNTDLHKLWYILLKERNMLLTMQEEYKEKWKALPNPERIDKVEESMENIETVVRERNKAYFMLETGETGERPGKMIVNQIGLRTYYRMREHVIPKFMNVNWRMKYASHCKPTEIQEFLLYYREKLWLAKKRKMARDRNHVRGLIKRYPDIDLKLLKEQYPTVNVEKIKSDYKSQGHYEPKY